MHLPVGPVGDKTEVRKRLLRAPNLAFHSARQQLL
jgi:hypothetical protein